MSKVITDPSDISDTRPPEESGGFAGDAITINMAVGDVLREAARLSGDKVALVDGVPDRALRRRWTYSQLLAEAEQFARALLRQFEPGDRIAVSSPNSAEWVILEYGVMLAGMVLVPVNPAYRESELCAILQDCEARALFHVDVWRKNHIADMARAVQKNELPNLALISLSQWDEFLATGAEPLPLPDVDPNGPVLIQFTSGTTGRPKGAVLHHGLIDPPRFVADACNFKRYGVWLNPMPMYHIGGAVVAHFATLSRHGTFVQMHEWDTAVALDLIESERCNGTLVVPTMLVSMLDHPDSSKYDLSSMEFIAAGAAPVPPALLDRVTRRIGCRLMICFGLTEAGGAVTNTTEEDGAHELAHTLGRALPGIEVEVRDPETGAKLAAGEMGEMWLKSSRIMIEYYGREEATRDAITPDGWLRSGDLVTMDERGYVSIAGRLKDMIIRGGANIYPREVEDVLFEHPTVAQAAVIGVPDEKWGEVVTAVVQAADGETLRFEDLYQHCRERLASFKVPALWCSTDSYPLNPTGKIQKFVLLDWVRDGKLAPIAMKS